FFLNLWRIVDGLYLSNGRILATCSMSVSLFAAQGKNLPMGPRLTTCLPFSSLGYYSKVASSPMIRIYSLEVRVQGILESEGQASTDRTASRCTFVRYLLVRAKSSKQSI